MILRSIKEVRAYKARVKRDNLDQWYRRNRWADRGPSSCAERDYADEDYSGRGLEFDFWDAPN